MKRLLRFFVNSATLLSLALCVATCAMWVRSYWIEEQWTFAPAQPTAEPGLPLGVRRYQQVASWRGQFTFFERAQPEQWRQERIRSGNPSLDPPFGYGRQITINYTPASNQPIAPIRVREWAIPGIKFEAMPAQVGPPIPALLQRMPRLGLVTASGHRSLVVSWWVLVLASSMLPALWAWRWYFRVRRAEHACVNCGYDLRATPHRCPECGKVPPQVKT